MRHQHFQVNFANLLMLMYQLPLKQIPNPLIYLQNHPNFVKLQAKPQSLSVNHHLQK